MCRRFLREEQRMRVERLIVQISIAEAVYPRGGLFCLCCEAHSRSGWNESAECKSGHSFLVTPRCTVTNPVLSRPRCLCRNLDENTKLGCRGWHVKLRFSTMIWLACNRRADAATALNKFSGLMWWQAALSSTLASSTRKQMLVKPLQGTVEALARWTW
ncbi:uncharacterized protein [Physcomitrium patens]|uniref:uncharacterized protein n=1 Tax=Physcomitrium patens TaxID=3218 RepID=UPI003CCD9553